jgi:hypothetical protein
MAPTLQNVFWSAPTQLSACPAGDSTGVAGIPSIMRISITYVDANCIPKKGVPPDSFRAVISHISGNAKVNDQPSPNADDSTNANGFTRITVSSFSGCGKIRVTLFVSGVNEGYADVTARTVDSLQTPPASAGRVTPEDSTSASDVNFDGVVNSTDRAIVHAHMQHWRRNALHGTLVRRTNYCETCAEEAVNTKGEGQIFWSPTAKYISHTAFVDASPDAPTCKVFIGASDPPDDKLLQFTSSSGTWPLKYHDYDPSWSPLNDAIVFDRGDSALISRGVPWSPTAETVISASHDCNLARHGDDVPSISPDGQWVAFSRCAIGGYSIWKIQTNGNMSSLQKLTSGGDSTFTDFYPNWAPDGQSITFQRANPALGPKYNIYTVPAAGGAARPIFIAPFAAGDTLNAVQPILSPDGNILLCGYGRQDRLVRTVFAHTLDPALPLPDTLKMIRNYADTAFAGKGDFPILSPRLSPDGTRLALGSKQVWAARRNMDKPPVFTNVGGAIADTTPVVNKSATAGVQLSFTVAATDAEGDDLTYTAFFLQDGMTFTPSTRTFLWTPSTSSCGKTFYVKFGVTEASGGVDAVITKFSVASCFGRAPDAQAARDATVREITIKGPNPTRGMFAVSTPVVLGVMGRLTIFDLSGRRIALVQAPAGVDVIWRGTDSAGRSVPPGIYLYRLDFGTQRRDGRVAVVR